MKTSHSQSLISLFLICTSLYTSLAARPTKTSSSASFIKQCCSTTTYPKRCLATLSPYASQIQTNPKLLATKSLNLALSEAQSTSQIMGRLSRIRGLKPNEKAALSDCDMAVTNSETQLQRAIVELSSAKAHKEVSPLVVSDVQTWTSTALTYAGTCMDGFAHIPAGNVKIIV